MGSLNQEEFDIYSDVVQSYLKKGAISKKLLAELATFLFQHKIMREINPELYKKVYGNQN